MLTFIRKVGLTHTNFVEYFDRDRLISMASTNMVLNWIEREMYTRKLEGKDPVALIIQYKILQMFLHILTHHNGITEENFW